MGPRHWFESGRQLRGGLADFSSLSDNLNATITQRPVFIRGGIVCRCGGKTNRPGPRCIRGILGSNTEERYFPLSLSLF